MSVVRPGLSWLRLRRSVRRRRGGRIGRRFGWIRRTVGGAVVDRRQFIARLHFIGLDALFLALEFADGDGLEKFVLPLGDIRQTIMQLIHARADSRDAGRVPAGGQRRTLARLAY